MSRRLERALFSKESLKGTIMTQSDHTSGSFWRNPDVVLREEDKDGGLLFNPDNNQAKVVNTTGLFIWKHCDGADEHTLVDAITQAFDQAPPDEVEKDVREFIEVMVQTGFIGKITDKR
ncbi:PqqD family peptide modification chaperone [candidate division KSB1 bacterium]|nr:PqqD family peptide modification chaperone [candidate division KSB1 bacterium]